MNFMGMGLAEIAVVLVVAFLVLGPNRTINVARTVGKVLGDVRRTFNEVAAAATLEQQQEQQREQRREQEGAPQAGSPKPGSKWESQPVAQPQGEREEPDPEGLDPEDKP